MPKFNFPRPRVTPSFKAVPGHLGGAWKLLAALRTLSVADIAGEADRPFRLALVGAPQAAARLLARLGCETPAAPAVEAAATDVRADVYETREDAPRDAIVLDAGLDEAALAAARARSGSGRPELRIALARRAPAFRPAAVSSLIAEAAGENAKHALVSALPGVLPATAFLLPATALGDMLLLTQNQARLLLKIAAAYGRDVDVRARARELLPVVGGAFGWRAAARELIGLVPGGVGLAVKGAVAYAGTYTVGRAAALYYGTGAAPPAPRLRQLYADSYREALRRLRALRPRR